MRGMCALRGMRAMRGICECHARQSLQQGGYISVHQGGEVYVYDHVYVHGQAAMGGSQGTGGSQMVRWLGRGCDRVRVT